MRTTTFLVLLAACGGESAEPTTDGSTPDSAVHPPTETALIQIGLEIAEFSGSNHLKISGGFIKALDPQCQTSVVDNCVVADCPQALIGGDYADPGKLTFSPAFGGVISFSPGPSFLSFLADEVPWDAMDTIEIASEGAEVPAFSGSVASPRTLDAGEGRSPFGPPISKSQPFTATWVPTTEQVMVELRQGRETPAGPFAIVVQCKTPGSSGGATVPAAALSRFLTKASGGLSIAVTANAMRETSVVAGEFDVTLRVLRSFDQTFFHDVN